MMEPLIKYIWLWMIVGIILLTGIIIFIFVIINKCISSNTARLYDFTPRDNKNTESETPPLPPRNQYMTTVSDSYENIPPPLHEPQYCEVNVQSLELKQSEDDYVKLEDDEECLSNDYDDVDVMVEEDEDYDDVG